MSRTLFIINEAAGVAGVGFRQKETLAEAKRMARKLRAEALGDPNERYALWKIGELEWLINLEEKDLVLQSLNKGQGSVNDLISQYNKELGKPRPDFKTLFRIHEQIAALDADRAYEMAISINKRSKSIAREASVAADRAMGIGDAAKAGEEFRYCLKNRSYLGFSDETFDLMQSRVSACARARDELPAARIEVDNSEKLLARCRIGEARAVAAQARCRLIDIRSFVPSGDLGALLARIEGVENLLWQKEDSLVRGTLTILKTRGLTAAKQDLQALRTLGVCAPKLSIVDQAILGVSTTDDNGKMRKEIETVSDEVAGSADLMAEMRLKAIAKAQKKADSIRRAQRIQEDRDLERGIELTSEIYSLVEKKKTKAASDLFSQNREFLQKNMLADAFTLLEGTVTGAFPSVADELRPVAAPVAKQVALLMPAGQPVMPRNDDKREKASIIITAIYTMIDQNNLEDAVGRFNRERQFLRATIDKEVFNILESTITQMSRTLR